LLVWVYQALCTYNGSFFKWPARSILSQSLSIDELIICDDGSNDCTLNIIESFKNQYPEISTLHQNEKSLGAIGNFEKSFSSKGWFNVAVKWWYKNKVTYVEIFSGHLYIFERWIDRQEMVKLDTAAK
jgi:glycosyltransferase involved in cell wall biosynthesis